MTVESAVRIAAVWLTQKTWGHEVMITRVQLEDDLALVFYNSRSGEIVGGNAPLLIDTRTGRVHVTGTAGSMRYYVDNFRVTGDPHIAPIALAKIAGWRTGAKKVSAVTLLKENTDLGLVGAKASIDSVLAGQVVEVSPRVGISAQEICAKLEDTGFVATVVLRAPPIKERPAVC